MNNCDEVQCPHGYVIGDCLKCSVLALIEKIPHKIIEWECSQPECGETHSKHDADCLRCKLEAILPQRDQVVAETVERCLDAVRKTPFRCHSPEDREFESGCKQTRESDMDAIRKLYPDPLYRQRIENAARLEELQEIVAGSTHWEGCENRCNRSRRAGRHPEGVELAKGAGECK